MKRIVIAISTLVVLAFGATYLMAVDDSDLLFRFGITASSTEMNYNDITTLGTAQANKAVTTDANIDVTAIRNHTITGDGSIGDDLSLASDTAVLNMGADSEVKVIHTADVGVTVQTVGDAGTGPFPIFRLHNNSASPANDDLGASIYFDMEDVSGNQTIIGKVTSKLIDKTADSEDGGLIFSGIIAAVPTDIMDVCVTAASTVTIIDSTFDLDIASHDGTNGLKLEGTLVTSSAAEINYLDGNILTDMTPGTGISVATDEVCEHSVTKIGGIFKTEILIDLTSLAGTGAANDIIGEDGGTVNCHIGQITAAVNGTIIAGRIDCYETPAGGNTDIDLYSATEGTGAEDTAIGDLTETSLVNAGAHSAGSIDLLTTLPAADQYLYLVAGANTDADFTAGRLLITLWGY